METRNNTSGTIQMLRTTEIKLIRDIHAKTLYDTVRNSKVRQLSNIQMYPNGQEKEENSGTRI